MIEFITMHRTPSLKRRLIVMPYEGTLLFGVVFIAGWLFSTLLQQTHALLLRDALQYWLFLVLGAYFVWSWTHGGQTLAMKTWHVRLVNAHGGPVTYGRAVARYLLAWLWFMPGLAMARYLQAEGWMMVLAVAGNVAVWALSVFLDRDRQFLHDRLAGTCLVRLAPAGSQAAD